MAFGKCDNCEQSGKTKQSGKGYILPLFFLLAGLLALAYEYDLASTNLLITILGGFSTAVGFVWLCIKGVRYISD
ncbi:hypothetical protein SCALIN_C22_0187 [Candidatus Scalindua japonica]|uniref:Uncharacterized protein n=1 Tax=Candidatus Scalindua japonica TaxID=1284222 RepID=A0A286U008_9BACT|nr:hypothetical protein [Candidatus Scalindua japonica]GAX61473.1 hypothetical protein SCALIN_C22_0187 [Candidatus Scalindua japonica]